MFANVLLEQIGLPIPAVPTLVLAGALSADGRLSVGAVLGVALLACTLGDTAWYVAGRRYGNRVLKLLCRVSLSPDSCVRQSETQFERWGRLALVLGKFVPGLSTIAPPLAGVMRLRWPEFLVLNGIGILLWAGLAVGAGLLFHAQVDYLVGRLADLGAAAAVLGAALLGGYIALKWWQRRRFYKMLRLARITADDLRGLLRTRNGTVVFDVRSRVARGRDPRFIPGALALDIEELDKRLDELPADEEIVFYCSCPNEASAAAVARRLIDRGYTRVRPLLGGLEAWVDAGYEVEA
ncbi:MAG TPA: DedA family protein/thiosulfate sulfurtransferase GlpE, partial [Burkholderiales bacterium]|nr:DedA family protein/thiosulfate sulfurtransferase GlpE [Burkholderiales bacterium]